jgi:cytochrome c oxidase assembly protein subunit 15
MNGLRWRVAASAFALVFACAVVVVGAYTRITDAGLGCPDWPGCYHQLTVPSSSEAIAKAQQLYPDSPVEPAKAWAEMAHRYIAGILGLLIVGLAIVAWRHRSENRPAWPIAAALVGVVFFQAALGMWTVTLKLFPLVVMGHLLGGFTILALLTWLTLRQARPKVPYVHKPAFHWAVLAFIALCCQVFLGGWTSANYAALVCPDFPTCHGQWWVPFSKEAFHLFKGFGLDLPLSAMQYDDRVTIQMVHRLGALISFILITRLCLQLVSQHAIFFQRLGIGIMVLLLTQVTLGIANVALWLPVPIAVAHNAVAALMMIALVAALFFTHPKKLGHR